MNQMEKTEVIIGLIASVKSKISSNMFTLKQNGLECPKFLGETRKIKDLDVLLKNFYEKNEITDEDYLFFLDEIKKYG